MAKSAGVSETTEFRDYDPEAKQLYAERNQWCSEKEPQTLSVAAAANSSTSDYEQNNGSHQLNLHHLFQQKPQAWGTHLHPLINC